MLILVGVMTASACATPHGPSVAVLSLTAKAGVTSDVADILTEKVDATIRSSAAFSRTVSSTDVTAMLNMEMARQLSSCDSASCLAEIAGSLGVDYIVTGNVGSVGELWIFNLRLIDTHSGVAAAAVSRTIEGASQSALVLAVDGMVAELLTTFKRVLASTARTSAPPAPAASPTTNDRTGKAGAPAGEGGSRVGVWALRGAGLVAGGVALMGLLAGGALAALFVGLRIGDFASTSRGQGHIVTWTQGMAANVAGAVGGVVVVLAGIVAVAGLGGIVASFVVGS